MKIKTHYFTFQSNELSDKDVTPILFCCIDFLSAIYKQKILIGVSKVGFINDDFIQNRFTIKITFHYE